MIWFLFVPLAVALEVVSPPHLACQAASSIFSITFGSQTVDSTDNFRLKLAALHGCSTEPARLANRTSVLLNLAREVPVHQIETDARCWQDLGAETVLLVQQHHPEPGFMTYTRDTKTRGNLRIPVLQVADVQCTQNLISEMERDDSATFIAKLTLTPNLWKEYFFDSTAFFVAFRIGVPVLSFVSICIACDGVLGHVLILGRQVVSKPANWIALLGSVCVAIGSIIRMAFFIIGPFRSTTRITFEAHAFLMNTCFGMCGVTSCVAAALLFQWGTFGQPRKRPLLLEYMMIFDGFVSLGVTLLFAGLQANFTGGGTLGIERVAWITLAVGTILISLLFWLNGRVFLKRLSAESFGKVAWRDRALRKAVRWTMTAGVAQILEAAGAILAASSLAVRLSPRGILLCLGLVFYGETLSAIAHSLAFRPITTSRFTILGIVLTHASLAKGSPTMDLEVHSPTTTKSSGKASDKSLGKMSSKSTTARALYGRDESVTAHPADVVI